MTEITKPDPALKGKHGGNCNREACQKPGATWYNQSTLAYYCGECAHAINSHCPPSQVMKYIGIEGELCIPPHPVEQAVRHLIDTRAVHRSGMIISNVTRLTVLEHTQAELDELKEAADRIELCDELGDVLGCLVHLAVMYDLPWTQVERSCRIKFKQRFRENPDAVAGVQTHDAG